MTGYYLALIVLVVLAVVGYGMVALSMTGQFTWKYLRFFLAGTVAAAVIAIVVLVVT